MKIYFSAELKLVLLNINKIKSNIDKMIATANIKEFKIILDTITKQNISDLELIKEKILEISKVSKISESVNGDIDLVDCEINKINKLSKEIIESFIKIVDNENNSLTKETRKEIKKEITNFKNNFSNIKNVKDNYYKYVENICVLLNEINDNITIKPKDIIFDLSEYEDLELNTYTGVIVENNIKAYISVIPPFLGTRSGYISQQLFAGMNAVFKKTLDSRFYNLFDKPVYIIDLCRDSFPTASALNEYIVRKMGVYYASAYHENAYSKLKKEGVCWASNISEYDDAIKSVNDKHVNVYFEIDESNKVIKFKSNSLETKNKLTNQPYWFVMKAYLAAIMAYFEKFEIDYSEISKNIPKNKTLDIFKDFCCKLNNLYPVYEQKIYYGAPGTGKSHDVKMNIKQRMNYFNNNLAPGEFNIFRTTLHPDYSYADFIGMIMPVVKKENNSSYIEYDFKSGVFTNALAYALANPIEPVFLVVEEMSRGNVAGVFGDIFQLLDRNEFGYSEYSINNDLISEALKKNLVVENKIKLPANLSILGTVNTSDQNVYVMDTAFKRRFGFAYSCVEPLKNTQGKYMNSFEFQLYNKIDRYGNKEEHIIFEWNKFYMTINNFIVEELKLGEDKQIGQFFIKFSNIIGKNDFETKKLRMNEILNKLLHYLWEDIMQASFVEDAKIFDETYTTFSKIYNDFKDEKNVFSKTFLEKYKKIEADW